jgi:hypothetical protein
MHKKALVLGFVAGLLVGLTAGYIIALRSQPAVNKEIERNSYEFTGDTRQLTTPISNTVDGDWSTKAEWNTTSLGDFNIYITENYTVQSPTNHVKWEFKAYHRNTGSLMPTPMEVSYWNGSLWKQLYMLDDAEHVNEVFVQAIIIPAEAFSNNKISIRTTIRYSSHVIGALPPNPPERLWHYVEYYEGHMIKA